MQHLGITSDFSELMKRHFARGPAFNWLARMRLRPRRAMTDLFAASQHSPRLRAKNIPDERGFGNKSLPRPVWHLVNSNRRGPDAGANIKARCAEMPWAWRGYAFHPFRRRVRHDRSCRGGDERE